MPKDDVCRLYLQELVKLIIEDADRAKKFRDESTSPESREWHSAEAMTLYGVLDLMQQQANAFMLPLDDLGLSGRGFREGDGELATQYPGNRCRSTSSASAVG